MEANDNYMGKEMAFTYYERFHAALRHNLKLERKRMRREGKTFNMSLVADKLSCSTDHFKGVAAPKKKKKAGQDLQEEIAQAFNSSLSEFVELGRRLLDEVEQSNNNIQSVTTRDVTGSQQIIGRDNILSGGESSDIDKALSGITGLRSDIVKLAQLMQLAETEINVKKLIAKYEKIIKET